MLSFDPFHNNLKNGMRYKKCLQDNNFKDLTCRQMGEFIKMINIKDENNEKCFMKMR